MIASDPLQEALYTALNGNITGSVVDEATPNLAAPYTVIGEIVELPDDTHTEEGSQETTTLHIYDSRPGYMRLKQIAAEIDAILHLQTLVLSTGARAFMQRIMFEAFPDADEPGRRWRHGVLQYRATITEAP